MAKRGRRLGRRSSTDTAFIMKREKKLFPMVLVTFMFGTLICRTYS